MSGICGVWTKGDPRQSAQTLRSICGGLSIRGGNRVNTLSGVGGGVGVASRFETQQIHEDDRVLLACDADLLNEGDLSRACGQTFSPGPAASRSTAALLAALYERFGPRFVEKLRGGFAIVLWDRHQRSLLAAIDGFGIKRLVYFSGGGNLYVASRLDALSASGEIGTDINPQCLAQVLNYTATLGPETILRNVTRLSPGTLLTMTGGRLREESFWDMRYDGSESGREQRLGQRMQDVVRESVSSACKDDSFESTGAFLSGGTDSSTIVGLMSQLERGRVKAFSIGFEEQQFNELEYAKLAAARFGAEHFTYLVKPSDCLEAIPRIVHSFDEPTGNSSAIPTYFCARLAAQHGVKTMLAGDGGDELFGGNEHYRVDKIFHLYESIPKVARKGLIEPLLSLPLRTGILDKARRYVRRANLPDAERVFSFQFLSTHSPTDIFSGDFVDVLRGTSIFDAPNRHYRKVQARDHLGRLLYVDMKVILADNDLPKVTNMTELAGVNARFPFLDRAVAEFAGALPSKYKLMRMEKRYLFKRAFANLLPQEIIRKKKHGFGIPVADWLRTDKKLRELSNDTLLSARCLQRGYIRRAFIEDLMRKHDSGSGSYYGDTVWTFLMLELWHRQFVDRPVEACA